VKEYYRHFLSTFGVVTLVVSSLPLLSLLPKDYASYLFPPLGAVEAPLRILALVLIGLTTLVVYFFKDHAFVSSKRGRANSLVALLLMGVVFVALYAVSHWQFVRIIPVFGRDEQIVVSVGYERTPYVTCSPEIVRL
jgi:hypothetical protein